MGKGKIDTIFSDLKKVYGNLEGYYSKLKHIEAILVKYENYVKAIGRSIEQIELEEGDSDSIRSCKAIIVNSEDLIKRIKQKLYGVRKIKRGFGEVERGTQEEGGDFEKRLLKDYSESKNLRDLKKKGYDIEGIDIENAAELSMGSDVDAIYTKHPQGVYYRVKIDNKRYILLPRHNLMIVNSLVKYCRFGDFYDIEGYVRGEHYVRFKIKKVAIVNWSDITSPKLIEKGLIEVWGGVV